MRIGIDIDGVLACFENSFTKIVNKLYPGCLPDDFVPQQWSWSKSGLVTDEQQNEAWEELKHTPNFWTTLSPYPENIRLLRSFLIKCNTSMIYYVTSRVPTVGDNILAQTTHWLKEQGLTFSHTSVLPVVHKNPLGGLPPKLAVVEALGIDVFLDDYLPTVISLGDKGRLLNRPW